MKNNFKLLLYSVKKNPSTRLMAHPVVGHTRWEIKLISKLFKVYYAIINVLKLSEASFCRQISKLRQDMLL